MRETAPGFFVRRVVALVGWVELLRNPPNHVAIETKLMGSGAGYGVDVLMSAQPTLRRQLRLTRLRKSDYSGN
jgi:hypothetical protein